MKNFIEEAQGYVACHEKPVSKYLSFIGSLMLYLAMLIFFSFFEVGVVNVAHVDFATIITLALLIYFFMQDWKLALPLVLVFIFLLWLANQFAYAGPSSFSLWSFIIILAIGLGLTYASHLVVHKQPEIKSQACRILIVPLIMVAELYFLMGWFSGLKEKIYKKKS